MNNSRAIAADILANLFEDAGSLSSHLDNYKEHADYQLLQEFCYGCCRWSYLLRFFVDCLLNKPLKKKDNDVLALLLLGVYQLREMRIPDHAAINETVEAATELKKVWAKNLINGVLRNYVRKKDELESLASEQGVDITSSHPQWLVDNLARHWPDDLASLLDANNLRPPMTLRVNASRISREDYLKRLDEAGIEARAGELATSAIYLAKPSPALDLPGFAEGLVSVQDEASQLVPSMLELAPGQRVLDACAAPGGKTGHILESEHSLTELVALDKSPGRLARVRDNLERLQLQATVQQGDGSQIEDWWDQQAFDRILLDAPCSATGVIRRHPDIKMLRSESAIKKLRDEQLNLLTALWHCLAQNGLLLYTTCSVLPEENTQVIELFLKQQSDAKYEGVVADWGVECSYGRQLLPLNQQGPDGFFYSLLRRK